MAFDLISTIVGFLLGTATGAAGTYFANKYTDQRREGEAYSQAKKDFLATKDKLPEFIAELKQDLSKSPEIREFFVIQEGTCLGGSTIPRFLYKHNNANCLLNKIQILENMGYI